MEDVCIIIPAYNPTSKIETLIDALLSKNNKHIIVVNDGSDATCNPIFTALKNKNITVLSHEKNQGKGAALKTAFRFIIDNKLNYLGVVTADADLQHLDSDIIMLSNQLKNQPNSLHLGIRTFKKNIPLRSLIGNQLTQFLYKLFFKQSIKDTQTGLRAIPISLLPKLCEIKSNRYEFELSMLIESKKNNVICKQHPITTIYINNNEESHFNPLIDSIKIYWVMFRYLGASLSSYIIDFALFILFFHLLSDLFISVLLARLISSSYNFSINHRLVFKSNQKMQKTILSYAMLCIFNVVFSFYLIKLLLLFGINLYIGKIVADTILYFFNFYVQRIFVFQ